MARWVGVGAIRTRNRVASPAPYHSATAYLLMSCNGRNRPADEWHGIGVYDEGCYSAKQRANQQWADGVWQWVASVVGDTDTRRGDYHAEDSGKVLQQDDIGAGVTAVVHCTQRGR